MSKLDRFLKAQERDYETALSEIKSGRKRSHWIWYIFPQVKGLGFSAISEEYGIDGIKEAKIKDSEKMSEDGHYYCKMAVYSGVTVTDFGGQYRN